MNKFTQKQLNWLERDNDSVTYCELYEIMIFYVPVKVDSQFTMLKLSTSECAFIIL